MKKAAVTGSLGLVGSEATKRLLAEGWQVVGIDSHMRETMFGLEKGEEIEHPNYKHFSHDVRVPFVSNTELVEALKGVEVVIHTAAQPSHDFAYTNVNLDFAINAWGTLNLLEFMRYELPEALLIHMSTIKVYGDVVNTEVDYIVKDTRYTPISYYEEGFDESLSLDGTGHSLFGISKLYGDLAVQEYASHFGIKAAIFRAGCITGPNHKGVEAHGMLSYMAKCVKEGKTYKIFGHKGKQVRDQIHVSDLIDAFMEVIKAPRQCEVYNIGGGIDNSISMVEAITKFEQLLNKEAQVEFVEEPRAADHKWWVSDNSKFTIHYPGWKITKDLDDIFKDLIS